MLPLSPATVRILQNEREHHIEQRSRLVALRGERPGSRPRPLLLLAGRTGSGRTRLPAGAVTPVGS